MNNAGEVDGGDSLKRDNLMRIHHQFQKRSEKKKN